MNETIRQLEPKALWNNFADLNAIPRASKKEERVIAFARQFGEQLGLPTIVDECGNVIIKKPATAGMENRLTVCLQSHLDMVHQKNAATNFDFDTMGIEMLIQNDWVTANGTTLGADNGIGVATIMALLAATDIPHPALEALFTIDEETGMTGAIGLKGGLLDAAIMLNLDTEEDHELTIGCAGGIDVTGTGTYTSKAPLLDGTAFTISIKGLTGGHSGMDIIRGRANANKLMNRLLWEAMQSMSLEIASIDGGSLRNAIPRESTAVVVIAKSQFTAFTELIHSTNAIYQAEYHFTDPNITLTASATAMPNAVLEAAFQTTLINCLYAIPSGIYRMDSTIDGLVQSSNNLARVVLLDGTYSIQNLTRSSVNSEKLDLSHLIQSIFTLMGANTTFGSSYPGWTPNPEAKIVKLMVDLYQQLNNGDKPLVNACHAGLECGILGTNYPSMEMISFGPTIHGAHSPDEKVNIASVQKFWKYLLATLTQIPVKA